MKLLSIQAIALTLIFISSTVENRSERHPNIQHVTEKLSDMKNLVSIVEIPTKDFNRAVKFYQSVFTIRIEEMKMPGIKIGLFPARDGEVVVQLINGDGYRPSADGTVVYLNAGGDLQNVLSNVDNNGGEVVMQKTEIGPDMGFYAIFMDTEGNKLGLYSLQ